MAEQTINLIKETVKDFLFVKMEDDTCRGWKRELLLEELDKVEEKYILCNLCQGLLRDACLFENDDVQELRCSVCLPENVHVLQANVYQDSVNEKYIACPLKTKGCKWTNSITQILPHLNECDFFPVDCPLGCVSEKGGGSKVVEIERRFLGEHQKDQCPMRLVACEFCDNRIKACEMNEHIEICEEYEITCPNSCLEEPGLARMKRKYLLLHLEDCPLQAVACPYAEYGCEEKMDRRLMGQHEKKYFQKHMTISMASFRKDSQLIASLEKESDVMERKNSRIKECLTSEMNKIRKELKCLISRGSLFWQLTGVKDKIKNGEKSFSDPFYVGSYKFQCQIMWGNEGCLGCFLHLMKGDWDNILSWPFRFISWLVLVNQSDDCLSYKKIVENTEKDIQNFPDAFIKPNKFRNDGFGLSNFISHEYFFMGNFVQNDSILVKACVERLPNN